MTDTIKLIKLMDDSGLKKTFIAKELGLSYQGFLNKLHNKNPFNATEIATLCALLKIKDLKKKEAIFFAQSVT